MIPIMYYYPSSLKEFQISDISIDKGRLEDAFEQLTVEQGVS